MPKRYLQIDCGKCSCYGLAALEGNITWRCDECFEFATGEMATLIDISPVSPEQATLKSVSVNTNQVETEIAKRLAKEDGKVWADLPVGNEGQRYYIFKAKLRINANLEGIV